MRFFRVSGVASALAFVLACGGSGAPNPDRFAGVYTASGGSGALSHVRVVGEAFAEKHPGMVWQFEDVGSDASFRLTVNGSVDLGFMSRDLKPEEQGKVERILVGTLGTAVAVNAASSVRSLSTDEVAKIFAGEITDWSQVGGSPGRIRVLVREAGSSTRVTFESCFFTGRTYTSDAIEVYELEETLQAIHSFKNSIGMVTISHESSSDPQLRLLGIDGAEATRENLVNGTYTCRRPVYIIYSADPSRVKPAVRAFLDWVKGPEAQNILAGL